jgi:hypothetical protein
MATILINEVAVDASEFVCDPLPSAPSTKHICLRLRGPIDDLRRLGGEPVPIVFPIGSTLFRGSFRLVSRAYESKDTAACTFVSDGDIAQCNDRLWNHPVRRLFERLRRSRRQQ